MPQGRGTEINRYQGMRVDGLLCSDSVHEASCSAAEPVRVVKTALNERSDARGDVSQPAPVHA